MKMSGAGGEAMKRAAPRAAEEGPERQRLRGGGGLPVETWSEAAAGGPRRDDETAGSPEPDRAR